MCDTPRCRRKPVSEYTYPPGDEGEFITKRLCLQCRLAVEMGTMVPAGGGSTRWQDPDAYYAFTEADIE